MKVAPERSPFRLGLTGGIGSGKSTVAARLQACGATLIDADHISRSLTASGGIALPLIAQDFGADLIDALADIVDAVGDKVDVLACQLGAPVPDRTGKNEPLRDRQAVAVIGSVARNVSLVA